MNADTKLNFTGDFKAGTEGENTSFSASVDLRSLKALIESSNDGKKDELEKQKLRVEIWKKAIETQMHFNDLSSRARQLGFTFVAAVLGLAVVLMAKPEAGQALAVHIGDRQIHLSAFMLAVCAIAVWVVRYVDINVYQPLLLGSVAYGEEIEADLRQAGIVLSEKGLTQAVSHFGTHEGATFTLASQRQAAGADYSKSSQYGGNAPDKLRTVNKLGAFYKYVIIVLIVLASAIGGVSYAFGSKTASPSGKAPAVQQPGGAPQG